MNYNHIFHAGNFADVLKHGILSLILKDISSQKRPSFILDTHSGRGRYNLMSPEAKRSKEAQYGILRLLEQETVPDFLSPYIDSVKSFNPLNKVNIYPGSPAIIQKYLRKTDHAAFCELSEKEFMKLHALFHDDKRIKTVRGDGYEALLSFLPPREKTGLVLIDPPFEKRDEILQLEEAILKSLLKWPSGTFMLWYPVKEYIQFERHVETLKKNTSLPMEIFQLTMPTQLVKSQTALRETAVVVFNPTQSVIAFRNDIKKLEDIMFHNTLPLLEKATNLL